MKSLSLSVYLIALVAAAGCATRPGIVLKETVGPARPHPGRRKGEGELVVCSALEVANAADADHPAHSGYTICAPDGRLIREVDNRTGPFYQDPVTVALPVGSYEVKGRATNHGAVVVPVLIEEGRTTVVDLEGAMPPPVPRQVGDQFVRLPDGQIVGTGAE